MQPKRCSTWFVNQYNQCNIRKSGASYTALLSEHPLMMTNDDDQIRCLLSDLCWHTYFMMSFFSVFFSFYLYFLWIKKLEIKKTNPNFWILVLKIDITLVGLVFIISNLKANISEVLDFFKTTTQIKPPQYKSSNTYFSFN